MTERPVLRLHQLTPLAYAGATELYAARYAGRAVIVKVARARHAEALAALEREAAILAELGHSSAQRLLGRTRLDGQDAVVLERIELPSLRQVLPATRQWPVPERIALARAVCEAVAQVHDAGVAHTQLTADHLLLAPERGPVRVIDFAHAARFGAAIAPLPGAVGVAPERRVSQIGRASCRERVSSPV